MIYSNPKWFVEGHPDGVSFHKPKKSTNDIGLLYLNIKNLDQIKSANIDCEDLTFLLWLRLQGKAFYYSLYRC